MTIQVCSIGVNGTGNGGFNRTVRWKGAKGTCSSFGETFQPDSDPNDPKYIGRVVRSDFIYNGIHYNRDGTTVDAVVADVITEAITIDAVEKWIFPMSTPDTPTTDDPKKSGTITKYGSIVVGVMIIIIVGLFVIMRK